VHAFALLCFARAAAAGPALAVRNPNIAVEGTIVESSGVKARSFAIVLC
jgi:hypothetical protein